MKNLQLAGRYAKAVYAVAKEERAGEEILAELKALSDVFDDDGLRKHLASPILSAEDKKAIVNRLLSSASFRDTTKNFLNLLCDKGRLALLAEVVSVYRSLLDAENGLVRGVVTSADDITPEEKASLEAKVATMLGKKLLLEYKKDPSLLGGVVVKVGDYTLDFSVNRQLERIKESLSEGVL